MNASIPGAADRRRKICRPWLQPGFMRRVFSSPRSGRKGTLFCRPLRGLEPHTPRETLAEARAYRSFAAYGGSRTHIPRRVRDQRGAPFRSTLRVAVLSLALLVTGIASAQDALVVGATADHLRDGNGGGASVSWIHPRGNDTLTAGATFLSLPGTEGSATRWAFATLGVTHRVNARTTLNAEANLGAGDDDRGSFRYVLLRGGVTRELVPKRLYGEAEWLQTDVARQQDGIVRVGATWMPSTPLTLRGSLYQSVAGDSDTTLGTLRADYAFGRITAIAGATGGTAIPALVQADTRSARVAEGFGGVALDAGTRRWTVIVSTLSVDGRRHHRLLASCRIPLPVRGSRTR
jgi:hypothetical protein